MSRDVLAKTPRLRQWIFKAALALAHALPLSAGRMLAYVVGTLVWLCDPRGRKVVERNLAHFIPGQCRDALTRAVRRNYVTFCIYLYESFRIDKLPARFFRAPNLTVSDPFDVFTTRPHPGPAILVTVHCNWELIAAMCDRLGWTTAIDVVALTSGDQVIDGIFAGLRRSSHAESLALDRAPLGSLRALKAGRVVGLVADRDYTGHGMRLPFAGETMSVPLGPAALAVQTTAMIIPLYLARRGFTRFHLQVGRPLRANPDVPKQQEVERLMVGLVEVMTRFIATAPAQWVSFHDGWKDASR
jgi:phosphatidylinositol dimannoside acyltransferase